MKFRLSLYLCFSVVFITNAQTVEQDFARYKRLADQCFNQNKYDCARKNYAIANQLKSDSYCQQKISQINIAEKQEAIIKSQIACGNVVDNLIYIEQSGKSGFVNSMGKIIIPLNIYERPNEPGIFEYENEGVIRMLKDDKCGAFDLNGNIIIPFIYDVMEKFSEGYASIYDDKSKLHGVIDKTGNILFKSKSNIGECHEGLFEESMSMEPKARKYGAVNKSGERVIPLIYEDFDKFSSGLCRVRLTYNGLYGYINKNNETVVPFKFKEAGRFHNGLSPVSIDGHKYGYINTKGEIVIPLIYEMAHDFSEGLARVIQNGKAGYINQYNEIKLPFVYYNPSYNLSNDFRIYHDSFRFKDGLVDEYLGEGKRGVIDKTGRVVIPFNYTYVGVYNNFIMVLSENYCAKFDKTGKKLFQSIR